MDDFAGGQFAYAEGALRYAVVVNIEGFDHEAARIVVAGGGDGCDREHGGQQ
ncbi:MAG: hypothetical protein U5Q44_07500 [Dehalococcoidia bacterium]|nr:hypothetical protein [Dehalococcoidia bacterium]